MDDYKIADMAREVAWDGKSVLGSMLDGEPRVHVEKRGRLAEEEDPCMVVSRKHSLVAIPTFPFDDLEIEL